MRTALEGPTYTFIPAQNGVEDLWSHVYTMQLLTCLPSIALALLGHSDGFWKAWNNSGRVRTYVLERSPL
jgi:hypothetical protein